MLVVDALGFTARIRSAYVNGLADLVRALDEQFHQFAAKVPHRAMLVTRARETNARVRHPAAQRHFRSTRGAARRRPPTQVPFVRVSLVPVAIARAPDTPRGPPAGPICRANDLLIGNGFIGAYDAAEKHTERLLDICAVQVSPTFLAGMPNTKRAWLLLCFFERHFYAHP